MIWDAFVGATAAGSVSKDIRTNILGLDILSYKYYKHRYTKKGWSIGGPSLLGKWSQHFEIWGYPNVFQNFFFRIHCLSDFFLGDGWISSSVEQARTLRFPTTFPGEGTTWMNFCMVSVGYNNPQKFPTSSRDWITAEMMTYKIPNVKLDDLRFAVLSWNFWTLGIFIRRHFSEAWEMPSKIFLVFDIFFGVLKVGHFWTWHWQHARKEKI